MVRRGRFLVVGTIALVCGCLSGEVSGAAGV
jgi:hypothetical protein